MSLSATLYTTSPLTPDVAIATAFPGYDVNPAADRSRVTTEVLNVTARRQSKPNFDLELFGFESAIVIHFAIDKWHAPEARKELAAAVRNFLSSTSGDVVVMYIDILVLKRMGDTAVCAAAFTDMIPDSIPGWTIVPELPQPE